MAASRIEKTHHYTVISNLPPVQHRDITEVQRAALYDIFFF